MSCFGPTCPEERYSKVDLMLKGTNHRANCFSYLPGGLGFTGLIAGFALSGCIIGGSPAPQEAQSSTTSTTPQTQSSTEPESSTSTGTPSQESAQEDQETDSKTKDSTSSSTQDSTQDTSEEDSSTKEPAQEIQLLISVDWEGGNIRDKNIEVMEKMRSEFPDIPLTHFLNAVYYTRPDIKKEEITAAIKRTIRNGDELGLHIHGWQSLFEAAGVTYRSEPTYLDLNTEKLGDFGYTVDIGAYEIEELQKVIAFSVKTLEDEGLGRAVSFRSGAWLGRNSVLIALAREGFLRDSSAVATVHFDDEFFTDSVWYQWLNDLWPNMEPDSQPFIKTLQDEKEARTILEIPDNGALADYVRASQMVQVYERCLAYKRMHPGEHVTMNFGFHDVNAFRYLERVTEGIRLIQARAKQDNIKIVPVTTETMKFSEHRSREVSKLSKVE